MKKITIFAAIFVCANAIAGPLGLTQGMTLDELKKQGAFVPVPSESYLYNSKTLTSGHPDFESYTVILTPQQGLCKIHAVGKDIATSVYGSELDGKFKSLASALTSKYGTPEYNFDFLRSGSIWNEGKDWMMALLKKERTLSTSWTLKNNLPDSLQAVSLTALAGNTSKGWLQLSYEFSNTSACLEVLKAKENSSL